MSSQPDHDSNLFVNLVGERPPLPAPVSSDVPLIDLASNDPLPELSPAPTPPARAAEAAPAEPPAAATPAGERLPPGTIWLQGEVLMCACPDCQAPMSIRLWLMVADCWQCGTSIELTEQQEREARRLLAERERARREGGEQRSAAAPAAVVPQPAPAAAAPRPQQATSPAAPPAAPPATRAAPPRAGRMTAAATRARARYQQAKRGTATAWLGDVFGVAPAWLVSLVFHLVLLTLLGLLSVGGEAKDEPYITLSTTISKDVLEGGETIVVDPQDDLVFDLPIAQGANLDDQSQREAIVQANQVAKEIRLDPNADEPNLPALNRVKQLVGSGEGMGGSLAARDPRIRVEVVKREGGTTRSEAAVARGLRWLAGHQNADGSWSLDRFNRSAGCSCSHGSNIHNDVAGTSLALLPFLGAGQTHLVGRYRETVAQGLRWLIAQQKADGDLRGEGRGNIRNSGMYAHGQSAIVLCEAFYMTGDEQLREPARKAIDFIIAAQHDGGGWRYQPREAGDTSVLGWQIMALHSARVAELTVPPETLELAMQYIDSVAHRSGAQYSYQPGHKPTHVMTAEALLCRIYLGWTLDHAGLRGGVQHLMQDYPPAKAPPSFYYWYYGTQVLHHVGGPQWERWNLQMRTALIDSQETGGHQAGSWRPTHSHDNTGGRLYATSLAVCTLEVYYRHLPIFHKIELE